MLLLPYRVKNPWKRFPIASVSIIAVNLLVYLLTTHYFLFIRDDVVERYAYWFGMSPFFNIFSAMFLHADIFHILGNMLFFWVFGPSVEDRLGIPRFLLVYFLTGVVGWLLQAFIDIQMTGESLPGIGASGCVMGILGAYWYLFSWSTVCVFYWFFLYIRIYCGVWEVQAIWIIGLFLLIDLGQGFLSGAAGGVANFAHVGGGVAGALCCLALRMKRDSESISTVKATLTEMKDLSLLSLNDLEIMRQSDPKNIDIIRAMAKSRDSLSKSSLLNTAFREAGATLIEQDPALALYFLHKLDGEHTIFQPRDLLRLARHAENGANPAEALATYKLLLQHYPNSPEHEMALFRSALCSWDKLNNATLARTYLSELKQRYPFGSTESHARSLSQRIGSR